MNHKKIAILFTITIFLVILSSIIFKYSTPFNKIRLGLVSLTNPTEIQTNFTSAIIELIQGKPEIFVQITENNTCYWMTPIKEKGYYIELKKYASETNDCYGNLIEENKIPTGTPIDIISRKNCLCTGEFIITRLDENTGTFLKITSG